jgi:hypothetical protein
MLMQVMSSYTLIFVMMMFLIGEFAFSPIQPCHGHTSRISCVCPEPSVSVPVFVSAPDSSMGCLLKCFTIHPNYETS